MQIIMAKHAGFCSGVDRSAKLAESPCYKKPIYTWGPLIHNQQFVDYLKSKNINPIENITNTKSGTIIIRSHGTTKENIEMLKNSKLEIIDGTCPNVLRVQKLAQKLENEGYQVVIFGNSNHPEVIGIASYVKNPIVVGTIKQAKQIITQKKIAFISQTTQSEILFAKIAKILKNKFSETLIENTICNATHLRQKSAIEVARKVQLMIIIGGKHSSNTKKLFDSCKKITKAYHIETKDELKSVWFKNIKCVGITAGASTPEWIIQQTLTKIKKY